MGRGSALFFNNNLKISFYVFVLGAATLVGGQYVTNLKCTIPQVQPVKKLDNMLFDDAGYTYVMRKL